MNKKTYKTPSIRITEVDLSHSLLAGSPKPSSEVSVKVGEDVIPVSKKEEGGTVVDCKWFIPSKSEWSAFGEELGITTSNYANKGLSGWYWSSSQNSTYDAYRAYFGLCYMSNRNVNDSRYVRLSATF